MAPSDLSSFLAGEDPPPDAPSDAPAAPATDDPARAPAEPATEPGATLVNDRYEVLPNRPRPQPLKGIAPAFDAVDRREARAEIIAHVCISGLPPRTDALGALRGVEHPNLLKLLDFGLAAWSQDGSEHPFILLERPRGNPMFLSMEDRRPPLSEDILTRKVIQPASLALRELRARRVFHGLINPMNLYLGEGASDVAKLGQCVSDAPGIGQPALFETIERGVTEPVGRGKGSVEDDLYALGITLMMLALGHNPGRRYNSDRALIAAKTDYGTFAALCGDDRINGSLTEPLRGLTIDDPAQRWTLDDLEMWINGRRLSPRQAAPIKRAARPIPFDGVEHLTLRSLAHAMANAPIKAQKLADSKDLETWIRRSLEDEPASERLEEAIRSASSGSGGAIEHRRLSRVLMALDPSGPIRYRGRSLMPDGIGAALADAMARGSGAQEVAEVIAGQLPMFWVNVQPGLRPEHVANAKIFDAMRGHLDRLAPGSGIERCLYQLNPGMPCLSPMMRGHYVQDLARLMMALDEIGASGDHPAEPIDRHVAAFIAAHGASLLRGGGSVDSQLSAIGATGKPADRALAIGSILARLQQKLGNRPLRNLCKWFTTMTGPLVEKFHSRSLQRRVREELDRQAATGLLQNQLTILVNANLGHRDLAAFRAAQRQFRGNAMKIQHIKRLLSERDRFTTVNGRQVTAATTMVVSGLILAGIVLTSAV